MSSRALLNRCEKSSAVIQRSIILIVVGLLSLVSITGCGSNNSTFQLPIDFIEDFIAKHETMVDQSLAYYYVKNEQSQIAEQVDTAIRINKAKGSLAILEKATFDFSGLQIELVDKKEEYIDDEPVIFVKVAVKGNYKMQLPEVSKKIDTNEIIILQLAHSEWKVTNTNNPWS